MRNHFFFLIHLSLILCFLHISKFAHSQSYDIKKYGLDEGLPQSTVLSLCQDKQGNIWFGTNSGGVAKFDGRNFEVFTESKGLAGNVVYSIYLMQNGNLLFGTNGGISIYDGKQFQNYTIKNGLPSNLVFKAIENKSTSEKQKIWIATDKGVCTLENNKIIPFLKDSILSTQSVWTLFCDSKNNIWFGTINHGAIKYNSATKQTTQYTTENGLSNNRIWSITETLKGEIYIGTITGIRKISKDGSIAKPNIQGGDNMVFYSITEDKNGNLWMTGQNGLIKFNKKIIESIKVEDGLPGNVIMSSLIDREGNIWLGGSAVGAAKISSFAFKSISYGSILPSDYIHSVFQDSKKNIWISVSEYGITKISPDKTISRHSVSDKKNPIIDDNILSICEDKSGNIFFGTQGGLSKFDGYNFKNFQKEFKQQYISTLFYDLNNDILLIGTTDGLYKYKNDKITAEKINISLNEEIPIINIAKDSNGIYWLGTENGVIKYSTNSSMFFTDKSGFTGKRVGSIVVDKHNNIWFGTDEGVFFYNQKSFYQISESDGLASNKIYLLYIDNNDLWIGTNYGLDRLYLPSFYPSKKLQLKHYGKEEGFSGIECNRNAVFKDDKGNLWFGTAKGINIFNPKLEKINLVEPISQITGLRLFYEKADKELLSFSDGYDSITHLPINLKLPYNKNHITFDFIAICMTIPSKVKYQFFLEGSDSKWSPIGSKTEASYPNLDPGDYTFYLKAMNNDGLWNKEPVKFSFTILPPWWRTWWFYAISTIFFISSVLLFIRLRTRQLTKAKIILEKQVKERTAQLQEEKEKVEIINKEVVAQKAIIEAKNQDITDSIKYAKNIQEAILPPLNSLYQEFKDIFIFYQPKDIVSGDFYWFQKRKNKKLIAAVDCTGHGVPGAFMSIVGNTLLNEIVSEKNILEPAKILNELHKGVKEALKQNENQHERQDGMDIALCALSDDNATLEYSGANRPLWIFRKNSETACEVIKPDKLPIGGMEIDNKRIYTNHKINVEKGDIVYMFSDGFADQFGGTKGKKFMVGNLQKKLMEIYQLPLSEQGKILKETFYNWKGSLDQIDDVLVMAFRIS